MSTDLEKADEASEGLRKLADALMLGLVEAADYFLKQNEGLGKAEDHEDDDNNDDNNEE